jgi:hypothetical protein
VKALSRIFRGKFIDGLRKAFANDKLSFYGECLPLKDGRAFSEFLRTLFQQDWVVYAKPPFGGPEHVLQYLARYTHRVAISNHRLLSVDETNVTFQWKDYAHHDKRRTMTITCEEFLRRFLLHVLPKRFPRIRYFGWLANRRREKMLPHCRVLLQQKEIETSNAPSNEHGVWQCPRCHGVMHIVERLTAFQIHCEEQRRIIYVDSS